MIEPTAEKVEVLPELVSRFERVRFEGVDWDLSYLNSFAFKRDINLGFEVVVVVIFSSHCFTHSFRWDHRDRADIPSFEIYNDGREQRVLDKDRYELSAKLLRHMILTLDERRIIIASESRQNFMTLELQTAEGEVSTYAVFFNVEKDSTRRKRLILRVQAAYRLLGRPRKRQQSAKKVNFGVLLKAAYEGRRIKS